MATPPSTSPEAGPLPGGPRRGRGGWFPTFATGRIGKWVTLGVGLVVIVLGVMSAGSLNAVEQQNSVDFLPQHAQSTQVQALLGHVPGGQVETAVVVYYDPGLICPGGTTSTPCTNLETIEAQRASVGQNYVSGQSPPSTVHFSPDGTTAYFTTDIPLSDGILSTVYEVGKIRSLVGTSAGSMQVGVTGPAAELTDSVHAANKSDATLLVAIVIVIVLLLLVYRSPTLWLVPFLLVILAWKVSQGVAAQLGRHGVTVTGLGTSILAVLVLGVGVDYALLLISRYREELHVYADHHQALAVALRRTGPSIVASGATVAVGLCCLLASTLRSDQGLAPTCAVGVVVAVLMMVTMLPAVLAIWGRRVFWPFVPEWGAEPAAAGWRALAAGTSRADQGVWARLARTVAERYRLLWIVTVGVLVVMALGLLTLDTSLTNAEQYRGAVGSVQGQSMLDEGFPAGTSTPLLVVAPADQLAAVRRTATAVPGVASVGPVTTAGRGIGPGAGSVLYVPVVTTGADSTPQADATVAALRTALAAQVGPDVLVGGDSAVDYDLRQATLHDEHIVIPLVLLVVLVVLLLLLRAVVGPVVLLLTVVLSFGAALGVASLANSTVLGFTATSPYLPLFGFIFLVALGCDYNIFLMARVREESERIGTRAGTVRGLATTGTVIASAGIVLAGTFASLGLSQLVVVAELGLLVAFGVLLDTFVVRSILVPSLTIELGRWWWWPGALFRRDLPGTNTPAVTATLTSATLTSATLTSATLTSATLTSATPTDATPTGAAAPAAVAVTDPTTAQAASGPPANWYPDPYGDPALLRYWDGVQWTGHTAPAPP